MVTPSIPNWPAEKSTPVTHHMRSPEATSDILPASKRLVLGLFWCSFRTTRGRSTSQTWPLRPQAQEKTNGRHTRRTFGLHQGHPAVRYAAPRPTERLLGIPG